MDLLWSLFFTISWKFVLPRFYVNIPLPLAAALDLQAQEQVQWQLLGRSDLRLMRLDAPPAKPRRRK